MGTIGIAITKADILNIYHCPWLLVSAFRSGHDDPGSYRLECPENVFVVSNLTRNLATVESIALSLKRLKTRHFSPPYRHACSNRSGALLSDACEKRRYTNIPLHHVELNF